MDDKLEAVRQSGRRYTAADKARDKARDEHFAAVVAALLAGEAPTDVAELSPFTATHLRQVARDAGVPAATGRRKGPHPVSAVRRARLSHDRDT